MFMKTSLLAAQDKDKFSVVLGQGAFPAPVCLPRQTLTSCLTLGNLDEAKIEESGKAGSRRESNPGHSGRALSAQARVSSPPSNCRPFHVLYFCLITFKFLHLHHSRIILPELPLLYFAYLKTGWWGRPRNGTTMATQGLSQTAEVIKACSASRQEHIVYGHTYLGSPP